MDLEPCFNVPNLVFIQLHDTKLGHMTNLQVVFQMMVQFSDKMHTICNSIRSSGQPRSGQYNA